MTGVRDWLAEQGREYRKGEDRPLAGYLTLMSVYGSGVGAVTLAGRLAGRRAPETVAPWDLALLTVATHRIARTLAKDPVTSPLRSPFTEYAGLSAPSELHEEVRRHDGIGHSFGELITCPMCLAQWVATALTAGFVFAPRQTRLVMATFTAVAGADFLQYLYAVLQHKAE
jgi:hypothetical protein